MGGSVQSMSLTAINYVIDLFYASLLWKMERVKEKMKTLCSRQIDVIESTHIDAHKKEQTHIDKQIVVAGVESLAHVDVLLGNHTD